MKKCTPNIITITNVKRNLFGLLLPPTPTYLVSFLLKENNPKKIITIENNSKY